MSREWKRKRHGRGKRDEREEERGEEREKVEIVFELQMHERN